MLRNESIEPTFSQKSQTNTFFVSNVNGSFWQEKFSFQHETEETPLLQGCFLVAFGFPQAALMNTVHKPWTNLCQMVGGETRFRDVI